ncbi:hypothetical protein [Cohaesibacter gelatinilyticus]|uniref:Uncharacterized protein n=1 Tax=Cohaesibacter gelatinilyticus TaxID=372072 RepID=A0A285PK88_9HYPH|nr:hypothetical protein [Cohaesibacter gelatinilyticus]SNZ21703.1 hypothetical protein SAMN06265368_4828 [Cohaesibacter gelatinilyticus]
MVWPLKLKENEAPVGIKRIDAVDPQEDITAMEAALLASMLHSISERNRVDLWRDFGCPRFEKIDFFNKRPSGATRHIVLLLTNGDLVRGDKLKEHLEALQ